MGYYARMEQRASPENPKTNLANPADWLLDALGARPTSSSVSVDPERALGIPAFSSGVRLLSETPAQLPLPVYRRLKPRGKERAEDHSLYEVLHDQANPEMTAFTFREVEQQHAVTWGDVFAEKEFNNRGEVIALWPLNPAHTVAARKDGKKFIKTKVRENGRMKPVVLEAGRVFHIPFFSGDGLNGRSLVQVHRETLGIALAQDEFTGRFFGQGAASKGALTTEKKLTDEAWKRLDSQRDTFIAGLSNAHRIAILEEGLRWEQIGIPPKDAEMLDSRKWTVEDIARILRVPPHALQHLGPAPARASVEVQSLELIIYSFMPYLVRWEQAIRMQLLKPAERAQYFAEFIVAGLLRGDTETRYKAYQVGRQNGFLSPNDVRTLENLSLIDGPGADDYHIQVNMATLGAISEFSRSGRFQKGLRGMFLRMLDDGDGADPSLFTGPTRALPPPRPDPEAARSRSIVGRRRLQRVHERLFRDAVNGIVRRETTRGRKALRDVLDADGPDAFREWLGEFCEETRPLAERWIRAPLEAFAELVLAEVADELASDDEIDAVRFLADYAGVFAARHVEASRAAIEECLEHDEPEAARAAIEELYERWDTDRPGETATREIVRTGGAIAVFGYRELGVRNLRWNAREDACDYCRALDGRTVAIDDVFLAAGEVLDPEVEGVDTFEAARDIGHPPLHEEDGGPCGCIVSAA